MSEEKPAGNEESINAAREKRGLPPIPMGGGTLSGLTPATVASVPVGDRDNRLVPCKDAGTELDLPAQWLRDEAFAGRLPCLLTGRGVHFNLAALRKTLLERAAVEFHSSERHGLLMELLCRAQDALAILTDLRDGKECSRDNPVLIRAISGLTTFVDNPRNY